MMQEKKAALIREQMDAFPILPSTVMRVMEVTSNPESSANDLMQAMLPDQSLCVTVLKLANSVLFGRPQRVDSLTTAIMVLGFKEVQSIALIKAIVNSFRELHMNNSAALEQFWEHSFLTAMAAKDIAQDLRFSPNAFFMAGLIHDIGKLVMLLTFDAEYDPGQWMVPFSTGERLHAEQAQFGFNHATIGGQLLRQWQFPGNLLAAVEYHHHPGQAPAEQQCAQVVELADLLAFFTVTPEDGAPVLIHRVERYLPDLVLRWRSSGLGWDSAFLNRWFAHLCGNLEQTRSLKSIFAH